MGGRPFFVCTVLYFALAQILLISRHRQHIAAVIFWMPAMTRDAGELEFVLGNELIESLP